MNERIFEEEEAPSDDVIEAAAKIFGLIFTAAIIGIVYIAVN